MDDFEEEEYLDDDTEVEIDNDYNPLEDTGESWYSDISDIF